MLSGLQDGGFYHAVQLHTAVCTCEIVIVAHNRCVLCALLSQGVCVWGPHWWRVVCVGGGRIVSDTRNDLAQPVRVFSVVAIQSILVCHAPLATSLPRPLTTPLPFPSQPLCHPRVNHSATLLTHIKCPIMLGSPRLLSKHSATPLSADSAAPLSKHSATPLCNDSVTTLRNDSATPFNNHFVALTHSYWPQLLGSPRPRRCSSCVCCKPTCWTGRRAASAVSTPTRCSPLASSLRRPPPCTTFRATRRTRKCMPRPRARKKTCGR